MTTTEQERATQLAAGAARLADEIARQLETVESMRSDAASQRNWPAHGSLGAAEEHLRQAHLQLVAIAEARR